MKKIGCFSVGTLCDSHILIASGYSNESSTKLIVDYTLLSFSLKYNTANCNKGFHARPIAVVYLSLLILTKDVQFIKLFYNIFSTLYS